VTEPDRETRQDVADVLVRYATGIDRRDWDLFRTCFTDDVEADYGDIGVWHGVDEITAWMTEVHAACGHTMHRITNVVVSPGEGDGVSARSYVDALVLGPDNQAGVRAAGWYDDELTRVGDGWRIARRRFTTAFVQPVGDVGG
jgi:3-phenylpropionate/cinnamic acid dioxygenase small subunit